MPEELSERLSEHKRVLCFKCPGGLRRHKTRPGYISGSTDRQHGRLSHASAMGSMVQQDCRAGKQKLV